MVIHSSSMGIIGFNQVSTNEKYFVIQGSDKGYYVHKQTETDSLA